MRIFSNIKYLQLIAESEAECYQLENLSSVLKNNNIKFDQQPLRYAETITIYLIRETHEGFLDKVFCISSSCENKCGHKPSEEEYQSIVRLPLPILCQYFCGWDE